jgi:hypothetical protein
MRKVYQTDSQFARCQWQSFLAWASRRCCLGSFHSHIASPAGAFAGVAHDQRGGSSAARRGRTSRRRNSKRRNRRKPRLNRNCRDAATDSVERRPGSRAGLGRCARGLWRNSFAHAAEAVQEDTFDVAELEKRPEAVSQVAPTYPEALRKAKVEGVVTLILCWMKPARWKTRAWKTRRGPNLKNPRWTRSANGASARDRKTVRPCALTSGCRCASG